MESVIRRCEYVRVLFINWAPDEDDTDRDTQELESMREQSRILMKVFTKYYNVEVEEFQIPRSRAHSALSRKLIEVQESMMTRDIS